MIKFRGMTLDEIERKLKILELLKIYIRLDEDLQESMEVWFGKDYKFIKEWLENEK